MLYGFVNLALQNNTDAISRMLVPPLPTPTLFTHCVIDACMCTRYHASRESFLYLRDFYIGEIHPDDRASVPQVWGGRSWLYMWQATALGQ